MAIRVQTRSSDPTDRSVPRVLLAVALAVIVGGCAGVPASPQVSSGAAVATPAPTGSAPSATPDPPSPTPDPGTPYDGIWASKPLTRADLARAITSRGLSDAHLDEWFGDWDKIGARIFEIEIGGGRWLEHENADGVDFGTGWAGALKVVDPHTIVAQDDETRCPVTYDLARDGEALSVRVAKDACTDPNDLAIQAAIYESSPFRLVQAADWTPPASTPPSSGSTASASPTPHASTSGTRQTPRPIGSVKGAPLGYLEYLPPGYGKEPSPLLVFLHGSGESGPGDKLALQGLTDTGIPSLIADDQWPDDRPFVVLSPQHDEDPPSYCTTADEIDAFVRFALKHYDVDPTRVYLTGLSCGAIGLWNYLGAHGGGLVAGAVPIAGYGIGAVERTGCALASVPIWAFHGALDDRVAVRGDVYPVTTLQACTDPPPVDSRVTVYPLESHDAWTITYSGRAGYDIYDWLLAHHT